MTGRSWHSWEKASESFWRPDGGVRGGGKTFVVAFGGERVRLLSRGAPKLLLSEQRCLQTLGGDVARKTEG